MNRVKDKVAIITGSASGIGRATALLLAKEGAKVIISDINDAGAKAVADEISKDGGEALSIKHDVTNETDWERVIAKTLEKFGRLDVLVNNAGIMMLKSLEDMSLEEWRFEMSINLDAVFLGTKYAIGAMKKTGGGSIINMSSATGIVGTVKDGAAYCASKGAVRLFTKAAALECSKAGYDYNIRVNSIHPGGIDTPLTAELLKDEDVRKASNDSYPIGRMGQPLDIAYAILYLASDESSFATGSEFVIDGGWTAR